MKLDLENMRFRAPGGATQLDVYSIIRPENLFFPTSTAAWLFTMAGMAANSVHGGMFNKSFVYSYVTGMRVIFTDGTTKIIDEDDEFFCQERVYMQRNEKTKFIPEHGNGNSG